MPKSTGVKIHRLSTTRWMIVAKGTAPFAKQSFDAEPWRSADWQGGFSEMDSPGVTPLNEGRFAALADDTHLYIGVRRALAGKCPPVDQPLPGKHFVELVFAPYRDGAARIEMGTTLDRHYHADSAIWPYEDGREDITARRDWDAMVWRTEQGYDALFRIARASVLPPDLPVPKAIGCNLFVAISGPDRDASSWVATCGVNYLSQFTVGDLWIDAPPAAMRDLCWKQEGATCAGVSGTLLLSEAANDVTIAAELRDPLGKVQRVETTFASVAVKTDFTLPCALALAAYGRYWVRLKVVAGGREIPLAGGESCFDSCGVAPESLPFALATTYDIPDDLGKSLYTPAAIRENLSHFKRWGHRRIYWIDYGPMKQGWWHFSGPDLWGRMPFRYFYTLYSLGTCGGDFLPRVTESCRELGIECYAIFKPFDLAICRGTRPKRRAKLAPGAPDIIPYAEIERVGGFCAGAKFVAEHPELCMAKNPNWELPPTDRPVGRIVLWSWRDAPFAFTPDDLAVYVSDDNDDYQPYTGPMRAQEEVVERPRARWSPAGAEAVPGSDRVRRIVLGGLNIGQPYFIVVCKKKKACSLRNQLFRLYELFDTAGQPVPHTLGGLFDSPGVGLALDDNTFSGGIEFDMGIGRWGQSGPTACEFFALDHAHGYLGFARRRQLEMRTLLDPSFPEVRKFWLDWIKHELECGVDGVDIRLTHHNQLLDTPCYSFARPIVEAYKARHGVNILTESFSWAELRKIRGEFWTEFLRQAKALVASRGKRLSLHFEPGMEQAVTVRGEETCLGWQWDWKTWIEEGIADEIVLKHIFPEHPFIQREILPRCRAKGIPVHVSAWFASADNRTPAEEEFTVELFERLVDRLRKMGIASYNFYEAWGWLQPNQDGVLAGRGSAEKVMAACVKALSGKPKS